MAEQGNDLGSDSDDEDYCPSEKAESEDEQQSSSDCGVQNSEQTKVVTDDVWGDFLDMVGDEKPQTTTPKQVPHSSETTCTASAVEENKLLETIKTTTPELLKVESGKCDEEVSHQSNSSNSGSTRPNPTSRSNPADVLKDTRKRAGGGISDALLAISKKGKPSVLEQSRQDWDGLKSSEGIKEELDLHSKGGAGYLCKQDFLLRADHRQFELERAQRDKLRKK